MDGNTTISIALIISLMSVISTVLNYRRGAKKDDEKEIENRLKVNLKLDQLCSSTTAILVDIKDVNKNVQDLSERVGKVEASAKSAHHRLDEHLKTESEGK